MVEQRLPPDADLGDDVVQRRAVVAVVREARECGVEDLVSRGAALADVVTVRQASTVVGHGHARRTLALPTRNDRETGAATGATVSRRQIAKLLAANSQLSSLSTNVSRYAGRAFW